MNPRPQPPSMVLDNVKDAELRFRVPYWLKQDLMTHSRLTDEPASRILRKLLRSYLANLDVSHD